MSLAITEHCSCGASIIVGSINADSVRHTIREWREDHRHEPAATCPRCDVDLHCSCDLGPHHEGSCRDFAPDDDPGLHSRGCDCYAPASCIHAQETMG